MNRCNTAQNNARVTRASDLICSHRRIQLIVLRVLRPSAPSLTSCRHSIPKTDSDDRPLSSLFPCPSMSALCSLMHAILLISIISSAACLYEDQVNKWDWRRSLVGSVDQVIGNHLSAQSGIIVSTSSSVIACLSVRNGSIVYRHVLEEGSVVNLIDNDDELFGLKDGLTASSLMSVSGNGRYVRKWDGKGALLYEKSLPADVTASQNRLVFALNQEKNEIAVAEVANDAVILTIFSLITMQEKGKTVFAMDTTGVQSLIFATTSPFTLLAADGSELSVRLMTAGSSEVKVIPLKSFGLESSAKPYPVLSLRLVSKQRTKSIVSLNLDSDANVLLSVRDSGVQLVKILAKSIAVSVIPVSSEGKYAAFALIRKPEDLKKKESEDEDRRTEYRIACFDMDSWQEIASLNEQFSLSSPAAVQHFQILPFIKSGSLIKTYKILITQADASISLISPHGGQSWTREESLADAIHSEFVDYPLSELDASIEQAFLYQSNIVTQFANRIKSQVQQLQSLMKTTMAQLREVLLPGRTLAEDAKFEQTRGSLTRDYFGLRKLIVILTQAGKIISIDTLTGETIWTLYDSELAAEIQKQEVRSSISMVVQRTSSYYPFPAVACVVTKSGFILTFDPVKGELMQKERIGEPVKQMMHLPFTDEDHVKGILLLTSSDKAVVHPQTIWPQFLQHRESMFMMTADPVTGKLQGLSFKSVTKSNPAAVVVWNASIPVESAGLQVVFKRVNEQVHSLGRVLGDRNVLYKYLNPNLAAVSTIRSETITSADGQQSSSGLVDMYLIDAVTGRIIYSSSHKKARGPVHIVHSENSVIYSFYNEKSRRTEISAIDLYEGLQQINSSTFSSLDEGTSLRPVIEHNTFIFPTGIRVMTDTVTEKGLTNKHLLIALASGGLLELPKAFLDPRRPLIPTPEHREEGLIPYMPELPIPSEGFVNYNKSLMRVKSIQTAGSGLESTCLLLAHGLDLFHSRVTPSKTFDILKDDFDHILITGVLFILIAVAYGSKWAAAQKSLKSAWT